MCHLTAASRYAADHHPDLNASTVTIRAARNDGYNPATTPIQAAVPNAATASFAGMTIRFPPNCETEMVVFIKLIVSVDEILPKRDIAPVSGGFVKEQTVHDSPGRPGADVQKPPAPQDR